MAIAHLNGTSELATRISFARITVVLFTALWSYDSPAAERVLDSVVDRLPDSLTARFDPKSSSSLVSFYVVPVSIEEIHQREPGDSYGAGLIWKVVRNSGSNVHALTAYNATRGLAFFPTLRVFRGSAVYDGNAAAITYYDSFTPPAIHNFLLDVTRRELLDTTLSIRKPDASSGKGLNMQESLRGTEDMAVGDDGHRTENHETDDSNVVADDSKVTISSERLLTAAHQVLREIHNQLADRDSDASNPTPRELSPDEFTKQLIVRGPTSTPAMGALLVVQGGYHTVLRSYSYIWRALVNACGSTSTARVSHSGRAIRVWIPTVLDSERFEEYARNLGVMDMTVPNLILLDAVRDNIDSQPLFHVVTLQSSENRTTSDKEDQDKFMYEALRTHLVTFSKRKPESSPIRKPTSLSACSYTPHELELSASVNEGHVVQDSRSQDNKPPNTQPNSEEETQPSTYLPMNEISGKDLCTQVLDLKNAGYEPWVIVHQRWCGFSQRVLAVFSEYATQARQTNRVQPVVLTVSDVDSLSSDVNELVDGFPTVLRLRLVTSDEGPCMLNEADTSSRREDDARGRSDYRSTGTQVRCVFEELHGPHSVEGLLELSAPA